MSADVTNEIVSSSSDEKAPPNERGAVAGERSAVADARWEEVRDNAVGSGIVPIAQRDDGTIVLLLAKEQLVPTWKGSFKWSAFEGGRKGAESIEDTTMREWREESLDCISLACDEASLTTNDYVCRFVLNTDLPRMPRFHVTYLVHVPYEPQCVTRFAIQRRALLNLRCAADTLRDATGLCLQNAAGSIVDFWYERNGECIVFMRQDRVVVRYEYPWPDVVHVWLDAQSALQRAAACVQGDWYKRTVSLNGNIMDVEVTSDYLEKHCVRWWTLAELRSAVHNGGKAREEVLRTYFVPVLREVLSFLDAHAKWGSDPADEERCRGADDEDDEGDSARR